MGLFESRTNNENNTWKTPVWFMRQAGRYHQHYQGFRKQHGFMEMCKTPDLACEITMGPIDEFGFDAAILFSDLLFPLEQLGMGLSYENGPPELGMNLETPEDVKKLKILGEAQIFYQFQADALKKLKLRLPQSKTLLGFIGAPFTLYSYACEGAHKGNLIKSKLGLYNGLYESFLDILMPQLEENGVIQLDAKADALCLFDTAAGELSFEEFQTFILPPLRKLAKSIKARCPDKKIVYYSKFTHLHYLKAIECDDIDVIGVGWRHDLNQCLRELGNDYYIQGNFDPALLFLDWETLETRLRQFLQNVQDNPNLDKWVAGLGHGVLPKTPERNVKRAVELIQNGITTLGQ